MSARLGHIEIFVKEPLKSKDFYINVLDFKLEEIQHDKFVWLRQRESVILLRPGKNHFKADTYQKTNIAFVIYTDDIEKTLIDLHEKGVEIKGNDGEGCHTFTDPDGNWIQLVDPSSRA